MSKISPLQLYSVFKYVPITLTLFLAACGGTGQDAGTSIKPTSQVFRGIAIDGYVARSLVFIDYDNNGTRDPWEPSAFTDNDGYYSYNPITNTDYCASGTPATEAIYCLTSTRPIYNAVIRVDGGYDVLTGEPFIGQMSRRVAVPETESVIESVISPLTTLFTDIETEADRTKLLNSLEIGGGDLNVDYLNSDGAGGINSRLFNKALKVHKVVTVLSNQVGDSYSEIGAAVGTPNDLSASVYRHLADSIKNATDTLDIDACAGVCLDSILSNTDILTAITLQTEQETQEIYNLRELELPILNATGNALPDYERISGHATNIMNIVNRLIGESDTITRAEVVGRARAVESFVIKVLDEDSASLNTEGTPVDTTIENAANFFLNNQNDDLIANLVQSLSQPSADLSALARNDFLGEDFDSLEEVSGAAQLPAGTEAFTNIAGKQLRVSDMDMGWGPNNLKDSEVEAYFFGGTDDATSGRFEACVKYIDGANINGALGEANTRGELVSGYWSLLGADEGGESYSLLLTIEFLGTTYQSIMKPSGKIVDENVETYQFRFDYGDEIRLWSSAEGMVASSTIPTTNAECEARLPSRVGL